MFVGEEFQYLGLTMKVQRIIKHKDDEAKDNILVFYVDKKGLLTPVSFLREELESKPSQE